MFFIKKVPVNKKKRTEFSFNPPVKILLTAKTANHHAGGFTRQPRQLLFMLYVSVFIMLLLYHIFMDVSRDFLKKI